MRVYKNTIQDAEKILEELVDEQFIIDALKNYYQENSPEYNRIYNELLKLKGEKEMLLYPFTDYNINEYEEFMFDGVSSVKHYVEDNTLYAVMNDDMKLYLENNWGMTQVNHDTDTKEFFYVDEYGKEYVIPYIEKDDQILLVMTGTYRLENQDETMK